MASLDPVKAATKTLEDFDMNSYPVDAEVVATMLGAEVVYEDMDGKLSGFTYKDAEFLLIGVNSEHSKKRQRFTIAHEIGHVVLHLSDDKNSFMNTNSTSAYLARSEVSTSGTNAQEVEANAFAAALLMPETLIRETMKKYLSKYSSIEDIAIKMSKDFDVSEQAMTIRLLKLGIFDI